MKNKILSLILMAAVFSSASAQVSQMEFIRTQTLRPVMHLKTWSFENAAGLNTFREFAFPIAYSFPYNDRLSFDLITSPFLSGMNLADDSDLTFNNITDTFVRGSYILGDNLAMVTVGAGIPSGKADLTTDELSIAGVAASRPLDNPVTNFGMGLNLNFGIALAQEFGAWVMGLGFGYSTRGQYKVSISNNELEIDPGDEFNVTIGFDRQFETAKGDGKFLADLIYTNYSEDQLEGLPFFEAGDKFLVNARLYYPFAMFSPVILSVTNRIRLDNKSTNAALLDNGNEFEFKTIFVHPRSEKFSLNYIFESTIYSNTITDTEGAVILGLGCGAVPGSTIDVTGLEFSGGLSIRL
jgi:hypothetical protein